MNLLIASERGIVLENGYFIRPKGRELRAKAKFATLTLPSESIDEKTMEKYISKKEELKDEIEQKETEIEQIKLQRKSVPKKNNILRTPGK